MTDFFNWGPTKEETASLLSRQDSPLSFKIPNVSLDAAGLVALADLTTIAQHTSLIGCPSFLDILTLCPGLHREQKATELNGGEYPASAAMTTGYVFRIENQATCSYLQRVGVTGHLVNLEVKVESGLSSSIFTPLGLAFRSLTVVFTLLAIVLMGVMQDYWGLVIIGMLILARLLNIIVVRRRYKGGSSWKGAREPGVKGDLLILVSQDRWIRLRGLVDDIKAVTSGLWLRNMTFPEHSAASVATLLVYLAAALAANIRQPGSIVLLALLLLNTGLLALCNERNKGLRMHGRTVRVVGHPQKYIRRLDLARELIKETGRDDWAVMLGLTPIPMKKAENNSGKESEKSSGARDEVHKNEKASITRSSTEPQAAEQKLNIDEIDEPEKWLGSRVVL